MLKPSAAPDIHLQPDSLECMMPSVTEVKQGEVLRYAIGEEAQCKCAARKLTNLGTVVGQCGVINSNKAIKNMEWKLQFVLAIAETNCIKYIDEMRKKEQKKLQFDELAPKAAPKLQKHGQNMDKLTVKKLEALTFVVFGVGISGSGLQKIGYVRKLK